MNMCAAVNGSSEATADGVAFGLFVMSGLCLSHIQPRTPYDFLPIRPSEAPVGILRRCCSRSRIRLRALYGLTSLHTYDLVE